MDLLVWLDLREGRIRAFDVLVRGQAPSDGLAALLERAIHEPLEGCQPAVPRVVATDVVEGRVAVERMAEAHGADLIDRDVAPLDAVFEQLRREISSPAMAMGELADLQVRAFYAACRALLTAAPWKGVAAHEVLRLDGMANGPLHVLLAAVPPVGFIVFLDESAALDFLLRRRVANVPILSVRFQAARRMAAAAAAAAQHGWRRNLVPLPLRQLGSESRLVDAAELELLGAVAGVLARLRLKEPFRERSVDVGDGHEVRATWPLLASPFTGKKRP